MAHYVGSEPVKIIRRSRNLIPFPYSGGTMSKGITFIVNNDASFLLNGKNDGTGNSFYYLAIGMKLKAGTYTLSYDALDYQSNVTMVVKGVYYTVTGGNNKVFTFDEDVNVDIYVQVNKGTIKIFESERVTVMLNEGQALPYEPYNQLWRVRCVAVR